MKEVLGGKGAGLAEMTNIGVPVPPGFTISTDVCTYFNAHDKSYPPELKAAVAENLARVEKSVGRKFGDAKTPLLVSVRSGARASMPGMMDTILNLGLNDATVQGLAKSSKDERFALDSYRRFIQMYSGVVLELDKDLFEHELFALRDKSGVKTDAEIPAEGLRGLVETYKKIVREKTSNDFPQDVQQQLWGAIGAVFNSWNNQRAITYRKLNQIPDDWGTAVNVQSMVFGNMGDDCATGVAFTRNPANGENVFYGEYLVNAQGEDVVAGVRTPNKISEMAHDPIIGPAFKELERVRKTLEKNFGDVQDFEFTIEKKKLFMLQTRNGKRTALAYVKIAHDMVKERLMTPEHAIKSGDPEALNQLLQPIFDLDAYAAAKNEGRLMATGLPAGPGAASGAVVFTASKAEELAKQGKHVVLARIETSPEDLRGMIASDGILTCRGGVSSHAALVARQMGKVCVAGAGEIHIDYHTGKLTCGGLTLKEGDAISINGSTGEVFHGAIGTADSELKQVLVGKTLKPADSPVFQYYNSLMKLADKYRKLGIRTNADQPDQVVNAVAFGAEGIGLCRTEHMFFEGDRIIAVRQMILADNEGDRKAALATLLPDDQRDFQD